MHSLMSKITFRADEDLVRRLEEFDASKSEVMREALRSYLDGAGEAGNDGDASSIDDALTERIDDLIAERLDAHLDTHAPRRRETQDINVNVSLDGVNAESAEKGAERDTSETSRKTDGANADDTSKTPRKTCAQCGENVGEEHVYCPNCGEKSSHRVFCDCGDELRSDWGFCPSCGRRTPAADVLDR
jgi:RNA polymerase subunit RPABC4/transcription elongation factor Spt4